MKPLITTSLEKQKEVRHWLEKEAQQIATECGGIFLPREKKSLQELAVIAEDNPVVVVEKGKNRVYLPSGETFYFHPGSAVLRFKTMRATGRNDPLLEAMRVQEGDEVLDCTLGLGSDAIIASLAVGGKGKVVGLEYSPLLCALVKRGLQRWKGPISLLNEAMTRIEVINADYREFLRSCPEKSFDIVYFDPFFIQPVTESSGMKPLRVLGRNVPLTLEVIREARRVARRRIVLKERRGSPLFSKLGFPCIISSSSRIAYGYFVLQEGDSRIAQSNP